MQRKVNWLMVLFSLIGGAIGWGIGEWLLNSLRGEWPDIVVSGLYFGVISLCVGLACLIAEMISPRLNGPSWRQRYTGTSWLVLVPATLVMLFIAGLALEAAYQFEPGNVKTVNNIVLAIDNSGSMEETDPNQDRYKAAKRMIEEMDSDKQVAVFVFNDNVDLLQPFVQLENQDVKNQLFAKIDAIQPTQGGTDIGLSLSEAMKHIKDHQDTERGTMVVLLSDGFSEVDTNAMLADYKAQHIGVHTIGLSQVDAQGSGLLRQIAEETGGQYYDVSDANELSFVFEKIYSSIGERTLVTERSGPLKNSTYYMVLHIIAVALIGTMLGLALGLVFDNRYLAKSFAIGGAAAGLLAGFLLEVGLSGSPFTDGLVRLSADLVLAGVITLFSFVVPIRENQRQSGGRRHRGAAESEVSSLSGRQSDRSSRGF
ncbi:VWA domain-containing protein [Paenibacillus sp. N3/727]|uniref:vWA domain-containing protein n=1 Tax=Paenibacillus sp. N3/727 TaxID=2925845 RepID=UPI001F53041E|nr:vWA domain-containing protein [Paenibacillus sp. N3/727]UNK19526.1 VWA domain-containing protein [Paenibacillus sp. N3/727]